MIGLVVGCAAAVAARDPSTENLLAQVATRGELQERLDARARGGDDVFPFEAALGGGRAGGGPHEIGKALEVRLAVELEHARLLVGEHILAEVGSERGEPLVDRGKPSLRRGFERRTRAGEHRMIALEHARLLRREAKLVAGAIEPIDAAKQRLVHENPVPVLGFERRELALDLENVVVGVGTGQQIEDVGDAGECCPRGFERIDGIGEGRRRLMRRDGFDLAGMLGEGAREGTQEIPWLDARERRDAERPAPVLQQRIMVLRCVGECFVHARHMGFPMRAFHA